MSKAWKQAKKSLTLTVSRRAGLRVAGMVFWTVIRAYLDRSKTVTFFIEDEEMP